MLLFVGYSLCCHSAPLALLAAWIAGLYYRRRARLEEGVLRGAFGRRYDDYAAAARWRYIPGLV
jgi:protein-S-isoprenylcysteine O-methyltransferase Ste14